MEASQQPRLEALSRFLVDHEPCGAGFDIAHPAGLGGGTIAMTCRGCGARYEHTTLTIELEREIEFEPLFPPDLAAPAPPDEDEGRVTDDDAIELLPADAEPDRRPDADGDRDEDGLAFPPPAPRHGGGRTRDRAITAGLLLFAAAAIAFVVVRETGDRGSEEPAAPTPAATQPRTQPSPAPRSAQTPPAPHAVQPSSQAARPTPHAAPPANPAGATHGSPSAPSRAEEQLVATANFAFLVPRGWTQREEGDGSLTVEPPGGTPAAASVQVFYEYNPDLSLPAMSAATADFLRSRPPRGAVSSPRQVRHHGDPAFELTSSGRAGSQTALGVLSGPYRYLVVATRERGASPRLQAATERALAGFRPR
jgi:hypothetical protein